MNREHMIKLIDELRKLSNPGDYSCSEETMFGDDKSAWIRISEIADELEHELN